MKDITIVIEDKLGSVITLQSVGDNKLEIVKSDSNENLIFISSDEFKVTQYRNGIILLTPIELPSDEEVWRWCQTQKFQKEQGEQEYTMIYEIDLPKILKAFIEHLSKIQGGNK